MTHKLIGFLDSLEQNEIPYICWKGFHKIDAALQGNADLDIFVPETSQNSFIKAAKSYGFLELIPAVTFDGIRHYYLYSADHKIWYHLHVYFRLRTGASYKKDFLLDDTDLFQGRQYDAHGIAIPDQEKALALHATRMKLRRKGLISKLFFIKERRKHRSEAHYFGQASVDLPTIATVPSSPIRSIDFGTSAHNLARRLFNRITGRRKRLSLPYIVAVIGTDGSGKSTLASALYDEFSKVVDTTRLSFGKPEFTIMTSFLWVFRHVCKLLKEAFLSKKKSGAKTKKSATSLPTALYHLTLACERYFLFQRAKRASSRGSLVIMDRCPTTMAAQMDGPKVTGRNILIRVIRHLEVKLYALMIGKVLALKLNLPLADALERNAKRQKVWKETDEEIEQRHSLFRFYEPSASVICQIDATKKFDEVVQLSMHALTSELNDAKEK